MPTSATSTPAKMTTVAQMFYLMFFFLEPPEQVGEKERHRGRDTGGKRSINGKGRERERGGEKANENERSGKQH